MKLTARDMARTAIFIALIAVCSWISIPWTVPVTLQTFAIFLCVAVLGGKLASAAVIAYILLGCVGVPVFSGFSGGPGALFGPTGGYIIGFLGITCVCWLTERFFGKRRFSQIAGMLLGLIVCYAFGTAWFMAAYSRANGAISLSTALGWCVIPFIIPDIIKLTLAIAVSKSAKRIINR